MGQKFWLDDPKELIKSLNIIPTKDMTKDEKLNALTRLVIIIAVFMVLFDYSHWLTFLLVALLIIIIIKYMDCKREGFSVTPTYTSTDFGQTIVAPLFAEEWSINPPAYDLYTNEAPQCYDEMSKLTPAAYPHGQILSRTNVLPSDEYTIHQLDGGTIQARNYANSAFLRHDLARRENLTRLYKKKLNRRYRNSTCQATGDTTSPFHSY